MMKVMQWDKQSASCDIGYLLDVVARLTNISRCTIHLPTSLKDNSDPQDFAQATQASATKGHPFDQELVKLHYGLLAEETEL